MSQYPNIHCFYPTKPWRTWTQTPWSVAHRPSLSSMPYCLLLFALSPLLFAPCRIVGTSESRKVGKSECLNVTISEYPLHTAFIQRSLGEVGPKLHGLWLTDHPYHQCPTAYSPCPQPTALCPMPNRRNIRKSENQSSFRPLPTAYCLLPTAYCPLPTAYCLLPTAHCLLLTAYYSLPSTLCCDCPLIPDFPIFTP